MEQYQKFFKIYKKHKSKFLVSHVNFFSAILGGQPSKKKESFTNIKSLQKKIPRVPELTFTGAIWIANYKFFLKKEHFMEKIINKRYLVGKKVWISIQNKS